MNEIILSVDWTATGAIAAGLMTIATFIISVYNVVNIVTNKN